MLGSFSSINHSRFGIFNFLLLPLSFVFFIVSRIHFWLYKSSVLKVNQSKIPIVVVGNITAGGTGKTPIVISIVNYFESKNKKVGVVSRGYGGNYTQESMEVISSSSPIECGDEPLLIKQQTKAAVAISKKRSKAVEFLNRKYSLDIIISDDGLQHYSMGRQIEIVVIDGKDRFGNGLFLPSGPLRDSKKRLNSVDFIINNGSSSDGEISSQLEAKGFINMLTNEKKDLSFFKGKTCNAVAGIGKPNNFFSLLESFGVEVISKSFPDHYQFEEKDLIFPNEYPIIMTSKDCVKCTPFASNQMWYLDVTAKIESDFYLQLELKL